MITIKTHFGAIVFIESIAPAKHSYVVVTNNTKIPSAKFHQFLCDLGFAIPKTHYLDPFMALEHVLHVKKIHAFGAQEFLDVMDTFRL